MAVRWVWQPKRRPSHLREAGVSDIRTDPTPSKTQGQSFWYFSEKVRKNQPEVEGENFCAYSAIDFAQSERKGNGDSTCVQPRCLEESCVKDKTLHTIVILER